MAGLTREQKEAADVNAEAQVGGIAARLGLGIATAPTTELSPLAVDAPSFAVTDVAQTAQTTHVLARAGELERLQAEQREAARRGDYPAAYQLKAVRDVLAPREPYTLAECAPTDVDAQVAFFETHGFVCVQNAIEGPQLAAVQEAWEEHAAYSAAQWEASRANGVGIARHGFRAMRDGSPGVSRKIYSLESDTGENPFLSDPRLAELTAP